jgi:hypothetical protein
LVEILHLRLWENRYREVRRGKERATEDVCT